MREVWQSFWKARPELFSDATWVRWSTPSEILDQLWEWRPTQNIRLITELIFPNYPLYTLQIIFILILVSVIALTSSIAKFLFSIKSSIYRDNEVTLIKKILSPTIKTPQRSLFPSPNYKAGMQSKMISAHSVSKFTPCFFHRKCDIQ